MGFPPLYTADVAAAQDIGDPMLAQGIEDCAKNSHVQAPSLEKHRLKDHLQLSINWITSLVTLSTWITFNLSATSLIISGTSASSIINSTWVMEDTTRLNSKEQTSWIELNA